MKRYFVTAFLSVCISFTSLADNMLLSLKQCIDLGIQNNLSLKNSQDEIRKSSYTISETRANLLPQLNGFWSFTDYFKEPRQMSHTVQAYNKGAFVPVDNYSISGPVDHTNQAGIQLQITLYNQTIYTALSLSKRLKEISTLNYDKAVNDLIVEISKLYFLIQNTEKQLVVVTDNILRMQELYDISKALYEQGVILEIDLNRVQINKENLITQVDNLKAAVEQQKNMMRFTLDMPLKEGFELEPIKEELTHYQFNGVSATLPELHLLNSQKMIFDKQMKMTKQGWIPSLYLSGNFLVSNYSDDFGGAFSARGSSYTSGWRDAYYFGLTMQIPIFDGLSKKYKIQKSKMDYRMAARKQEDVKKQLEAGYLNAYTNVVSNERTFNRQKDNFRLAENVCNVTKDKFKEGVASMTDLLQDEMRRSEAQNSYLTAHFNYLTSQLSLLKLSGQLDLLSK